MERLYVVLPQEAVPVPVLCPIPFQVQKVVLPAIWLFFRFYFRFYSRWLNFLGDRDLNCSLLFLLCSSVIVD